MTFNECLRPLDITIECPQDDRLRFLDLELHFMASHVCWSYAPRGNKAILPFNSAHSKLVKRSIAGLCFKNVLTKSCAHTVSSSFTKQVERLECAGYSRDVLRSVVEKALKAIKDANRSTAISGEATQVREKKVAVIPYLHQISHNIKRVGKRAGVNVIFSAPAKLLTMCCQVNSDARPQKMCTTKHTDWFVPCEDRVVYCIPSAILSKWICRSDRKVP